MKFPGIALLFLVLGLGVSGCATLRQSRALSVSVVQLQPTQASLFETSAALTVRYTNEATEPLALAGSSHRLYLNGNYVGRAVSGDDVSVPALGTATQVLDLHLENLSLLRQATRLAQATPAAIAYRLESRLHPAGDGGWRTMRTTNSGELDLAALRAVIAPRPAERRSGAGPAHAAP